MMLDHFYSAVWMPLGGELKDSPDSVSEYHAKFQTTCFYKRKKKSTNKALNDNI